MKRKKLQKKANSYIYIYILHVALNLIRNQSLVIKQFRFALNETHLRVYGMMVAERGQVLTWPQPFFRLFFCLRLHGNELLSRGCRGNQVFNASQKPFHLDVMCFCCVQLQCNHFLIMLMTVATQHEEVSEITLIVDHTEATCPFCSRVQRLGIMKANLSFKFK